MATLGIASQDIVLKLDGSIECSQPQQPPVDTRTSSTAAVDSSNPCVQYEDAENGFQQVIIVVNVGAQQSESFLSLNSAMEEDKRRGCTDISYQEQQMKELLKVPNPVEERVQAETAYEDETVNMLGWFRSTFSQAEKNGMITVKDFKHTANRHSGVS